MRLTKVNAIRDISLPCRAQTVPEATLRARAMLALIALRWLVATSVMPLFVGAGTGLASRRVLRPCAAGWKRQLLWGAGGAWLPHLFLVGAGLLRDGAMLDYAAVLAGAVAGSWLGCSRR